MAKQQTVARYRWLVRYRQLSGPFTGAQTFPTRQDAEAAAEVIRAADPGADVVIDDLCALEHAWVPTGMFLCKEEWVRAGQDGVYLKQLVAGGNLAVGFVTPEVLRCSRCGVLRIP